MTDFWASSLEETVRASCKIAKTATRVQNLKEWLASYREDGPTSSNQGAEHLAFQRWFHFKEAYSPKFVADTLGSLPYPVATCLDPFGGSGTTALTCRMLGLSSASIEVNPYLADLIRAKLTPVSPSEFRADYERIVSKLRIRKSDGLLVEGMPSTLVEPGMDGRYVFPSSVYRAVRALVRATASLQKNHERLLKVLIGSVLVSNSNIVVNGKGRRYRSSWQEREKSEDDLIRSLDEAVDNVVADLTMYADLPKGTHAVRSGDTRLILRQLAHADAAIFSPPYPNSFDYTDVYNLELWMLGYLKCSADNGRLRRRTLRSHVQTKWDQAVRRTKSGKLDQVIKQLAERRRELWNPHIPEMIGYYFDDLFKVFQELSRILPSSHHAIVAIGDSQYAGVHIDVATILVECVASIGFNLEKSGAIRSMRTSSQHGGAFSLAEHCLVFKRT